MSFNTNPEIGQKTEHTINTYGVIVNKETSPIILNKLASMTNDEFGKTFAGRITNKNERFIADNLAEALLDERATVIALYREGEVVGYSYAIPTPMFEDERKKDSDTAYIYMTIINPRHRGQRLVSSLNHSMLLALRDKGYKYVERESRMTIPEGETTSYADKITKYYSQNPNAIIDMKPTPGYDGTGPEISFRIDIEEALKISP